MKSRWKITMNFRGFSGKEEERGKRTNQKESKRISCVRRFGRAVFLSQRGERGALHAEGQEKIDWKKRSQHTLQQEGGGGEQAVAFLLRVARDGLQLELPQTRHTFWADFVLLVVHRRFLPGRVLCSSDLGVLGRCVSFP